LFWQKCVRVSVRGISLVAKHEFSKLGSGVRFSHPAQPIILFVEMPKSAGWQRTRSASLRAKTVPWTVGKILCRDAENRTRSACSQSRCTTGILHPVTMHHSKIITDMLTDAWNCLLKDLFVESAQGHSIAFIQKDGNYIYLVLAAILASHHIELGGAGDLPKLYLMHLLLRAI
jgi:hypothetical protein